MTKPKAHTLKRYLRDARREHHAEQYPGDLAHDLRLQARPAYRWRRHLPLGLAAAAAVALAVAGVWLALERSAHQPERTVAIVEPPTPDSAQQHAYPSEATTGVGEVSPTELDLFETDFASAASAADRQAAEFVSTQWRGRTTPPLPSCSTAAISGAAGMLPPATPSLFSLPDGLRIPAVSVPTLPRKELS